MLFLTVSSLLLVAFLKTGGPGDHPKVEVVAEIKQDCGLAEPVVIAESAHKRV